MSSRKIIFITGTDTGVGKTLLAALLLKHLRETGCHALAMKPFCSGNREDVKVLQSLQPGELSDEEANPYFFSRPVAPLVALRKSRRTISLSEVLNRIRAIKKQCDSLVIEGSGGLLVPLSEGFMVADLISALNGRVVVVARDRLGTINHTLLTIEALRVRNLRRIKVALMGAGKADYSAATNEGILRELLGLPVLKLPFLGRGSIVKTIEKSSFKKIKKTLAEILE